MNCREFTENTFSIVTTHELLRIVSSGLNYFRSVMFGILVCSTTETTLLTRNRRGGGNVMPDNQPENRVLGSAANELSVNPP